MSTKIDITSSVLEKGIDAAVSFLGKVIGPAVNETGLLIKDNVARWRYNNQLKILLKTKENCEKLGIDPKTISFKLLCPLLEYASMEENGEAQDIWASLLTNMVDSEQNIQNHVFPYILSQVSINEFKIIEDLFSPYRNQKEKDQIHFDELKKEKELVLEGWNRKIIELKDQLGDKDVSHPLYEEIIAAEHKKDEDYIENHSKRKILLERLLKPCYIPFGELKKFEVANLIRLGILKAVVYPIAYLEETQIYNNPEREYLDLDKVRIKIDNDDEDLIITELGELFLAACITKKKSKI